MYSQNQIETLFPYSDKIKLQHGTFEKRLRTKSGKIGLLNKYAFNQSPNKLIQGMIIFV